MTLRWHNVDEFIPIGQMRGHSEYRANVPGGEYVVYREPAPGHKRRSWYRPHYLPNGDESQSEYLGLEDSLRRAKASCHRHHKHRKSEAA